jgi:hypothetical protein
MISRRIDSVGRPFLMDSAVASEQSGESTNQEAGCRIIRRRHKAFKIKSEQGKISPCLITEP